MSLFDNRSENDFSDLMNDESDDNDAQEMMQYERNVGYQDFGACVDEEAYDSMNRNHTLISDMEDSVEDAATDPSVSHSRNGRDAQKKTSVNGTVDRLRALINGGDDMESEVSDLLSQSSTSKKSANRARKSRDRNAASFSESQSPPGRAKKSKKSESANVVVQDILSRNQLSTPQGTQYFSMEDANEKLTSFLNMYNDIDSSIFAHTTSAGLKTNIRSIFSGTNGNSPFEKIPTERIFPNAQERYAIEHPSSKQAENNDGGKRRKQQERFESHHIQHIDGDYTMRTSFTSDINKTKTTMGLLTANCFSYAMRLWDMSKFSDAQSIGMVSVQDEAAGPSMEEVNTARNVTATSGVSYQVLQEKICEVSQHLAKLKDDIRLRTHLSANEIHDVELKNAYIQKVLHFVATNLSTNLSLMYAVSTPTIESFDYCDAFINKVSAESNKSYAWIKEINKMLKERGYKKGSKPEFFYVEKFASDNTPTRYWHATDGSNFEVVINNLLTEHARVSDSIHQFWTTDRRIAKILLSQSDPDLPTVEPYRYLYAFNNGWLDTKLNIFYKKSNPKLMALMEKNPNYTYAYMWNENNYNAEGYSDDTGKYAFKVENTLPINYDKMSNNFGMPIYDEDYVPEKHWSKTTGSVRIIDHAIQTNGWTFHSSVNLYWSVERILKELDKDQIGIMFLGPSGAGKSTLIDQLKCLIPEEKVKALMANIEKIFGLQDCADPTTNKMTKDLAIFQDFNGHTNLDDTVVNQIMSNEFVELAVKGNNTLKFRWTAMVLYAANKFFQQEAALTKVRRIWVFKTDRHPDTNNADSLFSDNESLPTIMYKSIPDLIRKAVLCFGEYKYHQGVSQVFKQACDTNIWAFASPQLNNNRKALTRQISFIYEYVGNDDSWFQEDKSSGISVDSIRKLAKFYRVDRDGSAPSSFFAPSHSLVIGALRSFYNRSCSIFEFKEVKRILTDPKYDVNSAIYLKIFRSIDIEHDDEKNETKYICKQLRNELKDGDYLVVGLKFHESNLSKIVELWNHVKIHESKGSSGIVSVVNSAEEDFTNNQSNGISAQNNSSLNKRPNIFSNRNNSRNTSM